MKEKAGNIRPQNFIIPGLIFVHTDSANRPCAWKSSPQ
jgi:hypothetical protein